MTTYFANSFSTNGIFHSIPAWDKSYQVLVVRGSPQSAITIFLDDLMKDLQIHDIPIQSYLSCIYPDTPDLLIIPSLKQVILNGNNLISLLQEIEEEDLNYYQGFRHLDLTQFCDADLIEHYQKSITELEEKISIYEKEGVEYLKRLSPQLPPIGEVTKEMLLLLQSLFPVTAENTGKPAKHLTSSITSTGWLTNLQTITSNLKRRYILTGSLTFLRTFFQIAESRAQNLSMKCHLVINPLIPELVEGIIFPEQEQAILMQPERNSLTIRSEDIPLSFNEKDEVSPKEEDYDRNLQLALGSLIKAHSYREELDEYYWHTLDLDLLFMQRRRVMHQLMALCDGQELWQYFT